MLAGRRVLLIVSGGIAAYKSLELVRLLRKHDCGVTAVLTAGGAAFVTPLSLQALTENKVYTDLFSLTDESEMGHIQLSRSADLVVVAPATANVLAKLAAGIADDLASTLLLATDKRVLVAPAMNVRMWSHPATVANVATLSGRGVLVIGPTEGAMACNEYGFGRLAEPAEIVGAIAAALDRAAENGAPAGAPIMLAPDVEPPDPAASLIMTGEIEAPVAQAPRITVRLRDLASGGPLTGQHALVTSGPTHEPIDPVRYIANRSSGRQGHAIAGALAALGARVTLVTGPVSIPDPPGVHVEPVETANEMLAAVQAALPADVAVFAAAVADWKMATAAALKIKKTPGGAPPDLVLTPNPDILATISKPGMLRPRLVIGFAAETNDVRANAEEKRARKCCDWIVANDVSTGTGTMGGVDNEVHLVTEDGVENWPKMSKDEVARRLAQRIAHRLADPLA